MESYLLVIYEHKLSKTQITTLSSLGDDMKIGRLKDEVSNFIAQCYTLKFKFLFVGYCYAFYSDSIPSVIYLLDPKPIYVGRFDTASLQKCIEIGDACETAHKLYFDTYNIGQKAQILSQKLKNIIGKEADLIWKDAEKIEIMVQNDYKVAKDALKHFFDERRFNQ